MACENVKECACPKKTCPNNGNCCACVKKHRDTNGLLCFLFLDNDRGKSMENYYRKPKKHFKSKK